MTVAPLASGLPPVAAHSAGAEPERDPAPKARTMRKRQRSWLAEFLLAPFEDRDERVRIKR